MACPDVLLPPSSRQRKLYHGFPQPCQALLKESTVDCGPMKSTVHLHPFSVRPLGEKETTPITLDIATMNGRMLTLRAHPSQTVREILDNILKEANISGDIGLIFGARILEESKPLSEQGIKFNAAMCMVYKCRGG